MPSGEIIFIDTSIWIDYFSQKNEDVVSMLDTLLSTVQVATAGIILAELTQGVKSDRESQAIHKHFRPLYWIPSHDSHWEMAGRLALKLRRSGKSVNLSDCYIACLANSASASIYSLDKHFSWIADAGGCKLFHP